MPRGTLRTHDQLKLNDIDLGAAAAYRRLVIFAPLAVRLYGNKVR
jgi:hypothetical protein